MKERNQKPFMHLLLSALLLSFSFTLLFSVKGQAAVEDNSSYKKILAAMKDDLDYAKKYYEKEVPAFTPLEREAQAPFTAITSSYKKGADGISRSKLSGDGTAVIMITGDLMCQKTQQLKALTDRKTYDFRENFAYVKDILSSADFTVGNLETMLSESASYMSEQTSVEERVHCNAPSTYLDALKYAGFDMVVTANNHNCDTGVTGIFQTLAHLDQYKLLHTGTFTNSDSPRYEIVEIDGIKTAFLSYASYYNYKDEKLTDEGKAVLLNPYSKKRARLDIAAAKAAGAEFIITFIHWGIEYVNTESLSQRQMAKELADAGADYIVGSHPHALQPYDQITAIDGRRVPVIYSMGNFVSSMRKEMAKETIILKLQLVKDTKGKVKILNEGYIPCYTETAYQGKDYTVLPLTEPYSKGVTDTEAKKACSSIVQIITDRLKMLGRFSLRYMTITQSYSVTVCDSRIKKPKITVSDACGKALIEDQDYTIERPECRLPGIYIIKIKGIGSYCGTISKTLTIKPEQVTGFTRSKTKTGYRFTWKETAGADGYMVFLKGPKDSSCREIAEVSTNSYLFSLPRTKGSYRIYVAAFKNTKSSMLFGKKSSDLTFSVN